MILRNVKPFLYVSLTLLSINACSVNRLNSGSGSDGTNAQGGSESSQDINKLRTARPSIICGESGYEYLLTEYLRPQCGDCHSSGSNTFEPTFTDSTFTTAFNGAMEISDERRFARGSHCE